MSEESPRKTPYKREAPIPVVQPAHAKPQMSRIPLAGLKGHTSPARNRVSVSHFQDNSLLKKPTPVIDSF